MIRRNMLYGLTLPGGWRLAGYWLVSFLIPADGRRTIYCQVSQSDISNVLWFVTERIMHM